jgi:protein phosphatase-4 regulatory subunit 3
METSVKNTRRRVKVYHLGEKGDWDDKGTGHVACTYLEKIGEMALVVRSEKDEQILLESKIYNREIYQIQQDTLIVWTDPETDTELALSFQEVAGCKDIWDQISTVQKIGKSNDTEDTELFPNNHTMYVEEPQFSEEINLELPPTNLNSLPNIVALFSQQTSPNRRERLITTITKENYINKLFDLYHTCDDLEDTESLQSIFLIFKSIILLNEPTMIENLFSEEYVFDLMGALESDPELPKRQKHNQYLKSHVVFKEVVPFENPDLTNKIHQTFRIQYLKDVVLPRVLDDPTFATLNSIIFFNNVEIVGQIQNDTKFLAEVFRKVRSTETTEEQFKDLIIFIQELCNLAKALKVSNRILFYQTLSKFGFCDIFELALGSKDVLVRLSVVNIIDCVLSHDPSLIRWYILSQKPNYSFFNNLISTFLHDLEMGIRVQLAEILRILIDTTNMDESFDKENFLTMFYSDFIPKIVEPLGEPSIDPQSELNLVKESICDILSFCLQHHNYRIKYFILGNNIVHKVLKLANIKDKPLTLAVVRFFRSFIAMKDDFYQRHVTKENLFDPIVKVFIENGPKYNLLNSALIELFEYIRKENIKNLIQHLVETYNPIFEEVQYVETFKLLKIRYEQNQELFNSAESNSTLSE